MSLTVTKDMPACERLTRSLGILSGTIAFDSSYPTGGESLSDISKYFKTLLFCFVEATSGYFFTFDKTNNKVKAYAPVNVVAGSGTADANNTLIKAGATIGVAGTGTAYQSAGAEVLNTADLSGITAARFLAIGLI